MSSAEQKKNWVFGIHSVEALLQGADADSVVRLCLQSNRQDKRFKQVQTLAEQRNIPVEPLSKQAFEELLGAVQHQGLAAEVRSQRQWHEQDIERLVEAADTPFILILDGVTDPHNLGACLRSANGAGVNLVIVPKDNAASITPVVKKVACGAAELTPLVRVTNLARTIKKLKDMGVWVVGAADEESQSLYDVDLTGPKALVLGAEGKGLRNLTRDLCDYLVCIPMEGGVSSLNVSVATGICLFEALRQRKIAT